MDFLFCYFVWLCFRFVFSCCANIVWRRKHSAAHVIYSASDNSNNIIRARQFNKRFQIVELEI